MHSDGDEALPDSQPSAQPPFAQDTVAGSAVHWVLGWTVKPLKTESPERGLFVLSVPSVLGRLPSPILLCLRW